VILDLVSHRSAGPSRARDGGDKGVGAAVVGVLSQNGAKVVTTARSIPRDSLASVHYTAADITTAAGCADGRTVPTP